MCFGQVSRLKKKGFFKPHFLCSTPVTTEPMLLLLPFKYIYLYIYIYILLHTHTASFLPLSCQIEALDVGRVYKIRIGHNGAGMAPGWFLEYVDVKRLIMAMVKPEKKEEEKKDKKKKKKKKVSKATDRQDI